MVLSAVFATYMPFCAAPIHPTAPPTEAQRQLPQLWNQPAGIESADLFNGPWGSKYAPDASVVVVRVPPGPPSVRVTPLMPMSPASNTPLSLQSA